MQKAIGRILSHTKQGEAFENCLQKLSEKIQKRKDLPHASVERQLELLHALTAFDFGRFLIEHDGGLDGMWTHYVVTHPLQGHITRLNNRQQPLQRLNLSCSIKRLLLLPHNNALQSLKKRSRKEQRRSVA